MKKLIIIFLCLILFTSNVYAKNNQDDKNLNTITGIEQNKKTINIKDEIKNGLYIALIGTSIIICILIYYKKKKIKL